MEITGRLVADAQVKKLKDNRELVTFTLALNDRYTTKAGEKKEGTSYIYCSYWLNLKIATILTKASIVTVAGSIGINAYKTNDGEFHATLTFHCNYIKLIGKGKDVLLPTEVNEQQHQNITNND